LEGGYELKAKAEEEDYGYGGYKKGHPDFDYYGSQQRKQQDEPYDAWEDVRQAKQEENWGR